MIKIFPYSLLILAISFAIPSLATESVLQQQFLEPQDQYRPMVRWWWPGAAAEAKQLQDELLLLKSHGFAGAEIQSFTPNFIRLKPNEKATVNLYAEPRFFELVQAAGDTAARNGQWLDYTLGSAWPSGGGFAVTPELAMLELTMAVTTVEGGNKTPLTLKIPKRTKRLGDLNSFDARVKDPKVADWRERIDRRARIVAVVAVKGSSPQLKPVGPTAGFKLYPWDDVNQSGELDASTALVLTDKLQQDGQLNWQAPEGTWQVFVFKQYVADTGVLGAAGLGPQLVVDHMRPEAFAAHVGRVGAPLGKAPTGIRATFVDSLELMQDLHWTDSFLSEFDKRRGYDLTPYLPFILQPGWMQAWGEHYSLPYFDTKDALAERIRTDYRKTVSELMFDGFIKPFIAWNQHQGLKSKFQAHGGAIDIIKGYGSVDIPETEDLVHGGDPIMMRFARSGAHLYGRKLISAESMVWKDRPYEVTPDELRRRVDLIIAGGVNSLVLHGMNYSFHTDQWPGWHAFQPSPFSTGFSSMLNQTNPIWPAVKPLAQYITRLQSLMQSGQALVPVALYYGQTGYYVGIEDQGQGSQRMEKSLLSGGYDFDRINPESLLNAKVKQGQLQAASGFTYQTLILPPLTALDAKVAEKVAEFSKQGLKIFFLDQLPTRHDGFLHARKQDANVQKAVKKALQHGARQIYSSEVAQELRKTGIAANLEFLSSELGGVYFVQRKILNSTVTFISNTSNQARDASLKLPDPSAVQRWDPMDGSVQDLQVGMIKDQAQVALQLAPGESALLVQSAELPPVVSAGKTDDQIVSLSNDGWELNVQGYQSRQTFKQQWHNFILQDWQQVPELQRFSGQATYKKSIEAQAKWLVQGNSVWLDLGTVHDMAIVSVNGEVLQASIRFPYKVNIAKLLKPGKNLLEIKVMNTLQNTMLHDKAAGFKNLKPVPAGLLGPVQLQLVQGAQ